MSILILYTSEDGKSRVQLRADKHTAEFTHWEVAELFVVRTDNIGLQLKNRYDHWELSREATIEEPSVAQEIFA